MGPTPPHDRLRISEEALRSEDQVRSPADLQRLSDFDRRIYLPLVLSAILPIVVAAGRAAEDSWVSIVVNVAAWLVFVLDLVVHVRLIRGYLHSPIGLFDLAVVIVTAPWFLIPGFGGSQVLVVARLARLVRLLFVTKGARRAASRLGKVGLFALAMLLFSSWMDYVAEQPTNPEFASFRDAVWWGIVTLTTVGYGDIVPITEEGRVAGTALMFTGVATLGLISGTLASVFGIQPNEAKPADGQSPGPGVSKAAGPSSATGVINEDDRVTELAAVRGELTAIQQRLVAIANASGPDTASSA